MSDGVVHRKAVGAELSVIRFNSYAFDLSAFGSASSEVLLFAKDRTLGFLLNPDPDDPHVCRSAAAIPRRTAPTADRMDLPDRLRTDRARGRRGRPVAPRGARPPAGHRARRSRWWCAGWASSPPAKPQNSPAYVPLVYAVPFGFAALSVWFIYARRSMELPVAWAEGPDGFVRGIGDRVILVRHRLLGHRAPGEGSR